MMVVLMMKTVVVLLCQVAYWAFPQDLRRVRAYAYLTDRLVSWRRGNSLVKDEKIKEMSQVGKK